MPRAGTAGEAVPIDLVRTLLAGQMDAALAMLDDCLRQCPDDCWDGLIARYPLWHVAYHVLCFVDLYLSPGEDTFQPGPMQPQGWREFDDEYPSRRFDKPELLQYLDHCRRKAAAVLGAETPASLAGPSGFSRLPFSRGELHVYNLRHVQHHTGQLSAFVRRHGGEPRWVKSG